MSEENYPGYKPVELAINEDLIAADYIDALRDVLRATGLFAAEAVDDVKVTVTKFVKSAAQNEIALQTPAVYTADNHIYEISVSTPTSSEPIKGFLDVADPIAGLSVEAQKVYISLQLGLKSFGYVEKLAEHFRMAVNHQFPMTSQPAVSVDAPFTVSVATRRTLDEFFMVAIEMLKQRMANAVALQQNISAQQIPAASNSIKPKR